MDPLGLFGPQLQPQPDPEGAEGQVAPPAGVATADSGGDSPPAGVGAPRTGLLGPSQSRIELLDKLLSSHDILASNMRVDGSCFLELFAGEAILTVAFMMNNVPCIKPWDHDFGEEFDVVKMN